MPWRESCKMDERMKFIGRLQDGEKMSHLCVEFGISRQTGHKFLNRYKKEGIEGLKDKRRSPFRKAHLTDPNIERVILKLKKEKPHWGAAKIREIYIRRYSDIKPPAKSTFHAIFDRNGLVKKRKKRGHGFKATGTWLSTPKEPNDLWCTDFKGEFLLSGGRPRKYCYPLTISDCVSRYLISCEALESVKISSSFPVFERAFKIQCRSISFQCWFYSLKISLAFHSYLPSHFCNNCSYDDKRYFCGSSQPWAYRNKDDSKVCEDCCSFEFRDRRENCFCYF